MWKLALRVLAAALGIYLLVSPPAVPGSLQHSAELAAKALGAGILLLAVLPYGKPRNRVVAREGHPEDEL
ncbi:MAG: hypothetical protein P4L84_12750 [Isosphaeraceae bacterium]|nr:hypothetical protein [Isosphaeraceae bacterium]